MHFARRDFAIEDKPEFGWASGSESGYLIVKFEWNRGVNSRAAAIAPPPFFSKLMASSYKLDDLKTTKNAARAAMEANDLQQEKLKIYIRQLQAEMESLDGMIVRPPRL